MVTSALLMERLAGQLQGAWQHVIHHGRTLVSAWLEGGAVERGVASALQGPQQQSGAGRCV